MGHQHEPVTTEETDTPTHQPAPKLPSRLIVKAGTEDLP